jgi:hypothetical protein
MHVQISSVIREKAAEAAEIVAGQLKATSNTKPVSMVGVGTADVLATKRVRSNELVDSLSSMLEYPYNLVAPGGFQACYEAFLLQTCDEVPLPEYSWKA